MANPGVVATADLLIQAQVDTAQLNRQAVQAANQFNRAFQTTQKQFRSQALANQVAAVNALSGAFGGMLAPSAAAGQQLSAFARMATAANKAAVSLNTVLIGAAAGTAGLAAAAVGLTAAMANTAGDFQALESSLDAIIDNSETASTTTDKFIGQLRELALQSGRSSQMLANTGRQFLALGFSGDHTVEVLTAFTEAASLTGATNQQLQLALNGVSQIASKGAVSMEELRRQIAENLPGAVSLTTFFEFLGEEMGVSTAEARKLQEQGLAPAEEGIRALVRTVRDATDGIDVFAIRARTLSGIVGIIREGFTQAVQNGFQPFIETVLDAGGALGDLLSSLGGGGGGGVGGALSGLEGLISRFGQTMGTALVDTINAVLPLIPGLANLFVTLTEAMAPVIVDLIRSGAAFVQILLPALNAAAMGLRFLLTELGPVSFILRQLVGGGLIAGVVRGFGLFGRATGSLGGFIGRVATPLTNFFKTISEGGGVVGAIVAQFGVLRPAISAIANVLGPVVTALGVAVIAFKAFNVQARIAAAMTTLNTQLGLRSAAMQNFAGSVGNLVTRLRTSIASLTRFKAAVAGIGLAAATVAVLGLATAYQRLGDEIKDSLSAVKKDIDTSSIEGVRLGIERATGELEKFEKKSNSIGSKIARNIFGTNDQVPFLSDLSDRFTGEEGAREQRALIEELKTQGVLLESVYARVAKATGASMDEIRAKAAELGISLADILPQQELSIGDRLIKGFEKVPEKIGEVTQALDDFQSQMQDLFGAAESLQSAQENLTAANQAYADALDELTEANEELADAIADLAELEAERLEILADTTSETRELAAAQDDLLRSQYRLRDIEQERDQILADIAELEAPATAEELAEADRNIERAKIRANRARRDELALQQSLNAEAVQAVDLAGMSIDQVRNHLGGIRLTLAAQRAVKKEEKSQEEIQEELALARLEVLDADADLVEAEQAKVDLQNRQLENQDEIREKKEDLLDLDLDRNDALRDQAVKEGKIGELLSGNTTKAKELKAIDEDIAVATERVETAQSNVETSTTNVHIKLGEIHTATENVRLKTLELHSAQALIEGDLGRHLKLEQDILREKGNQLGLSDQLIGKLAEQNALLVTQEGLLKGLPGMQLLTVEQMQNIMRGPQPEHGSQAELAIRAMANAIFTTPEWAREVTTIGQHAGLTGPAKRAFAAGGMVTQRTFAEIGEAGHEMVLPLTRPDRVWSLLSQHLPRYPGALGAAQAALGGSPKGVSLPKLGSGGPVVRRADGPPTYGQTEELIQLLKEYRGEVRVEAPITISSSTNNEDLIAKKVSRKVMREVLDELRKHR